MLRHPCSLYVALLILPVIVLARSLQDQEVRPVDPASSSQGGVNQLIQALMVIDREKERLEELDEKFSLALLAKTEPKYQDKVQQIDDDNTMLEKALIDKIVEEQTQNDIPELLDGFKIGSDALSPAPLANERLSRPAQVAGELPEVPLEDRASMPGDQNYGVDVQNGDQDEDRQTALLDAVREEEQIQREEEKQIERAEELIGVARGVVNSMPRGYSSDAAIDAITKALQELRSRQFLDPSIRPQLSPETIAIMDNQWKLNPHLRKLVEIFNKENEDEMPLQDARVTEKREEKKSRDVRGCPALVALTNDCSAADNIGLDIDNEARSLCRNHQLCYTCAEMYGLSAMDCDTTYMNSVTSLCLLENSDAVKRGSCMVGGIQLYVSMMKSVANSRHAKYLIKSPSPSICGSTCVKNYLPMGAF